MGQYKLALFDMDGTLLKQRTIFIFAEKLGFMEEVKKYINSDLEPYRRTIEIAKLLKGKNQEELLKIHRKISLQKNAKKVIETLKNKKIKTAIATDSYQFVADDLKKRLDMDYAFANTLITNKDIITGKIRIHNQDMEKDFISGKTFSICKDKVLSYLCSKLGIKENEAIAVGDGKVDASMISRAGLGIAYKAPDLTKKHADIIINDLGDILKYV